MTGPGGGVGPDGLEMRHVEALLAVADHGHLGGAAARLGIDADELRGRLRRAEWLLGTEVFTGSPTGIVPTPAGRRVLHEARRTMASAEALRDELARLDAPGTTIRMRVSRSLDAAFVPVLTRRAPDVDWSVRPVPSPAGLDAVAGGDADLFLGISFPGDTGFVLPAGLVAHHVLDERPRLLVGRGHPRAGDRSVPLAELAAASWAVAADPASERYLRIAAGAVGFEPDVAYRSEEAHVVTELVARGFAVAVRSAVPTADERLVALDCPDLLPVACMLVHRVDGPASAVVRTVVETVRWVHAARAAAHPGPVTAAARELGAVDPAPDRPGSAARPLRFGAIGHPAVAPAVRGLADRAALFLDAVAPQERADVLMEAVRAGHLDLAMGQDHPYGRVEPASGVARRTLVAAEPMFLAVGPRHPFAARESVSAREAVRAEWIDAPADPTRPSATAAFWTAVSGEPVAMHRFADPGSAVDLLADGELVAMAAATSVESRLRYVRLEHPLAFRRLFLLWRPERVTAEAVEAVADELLARMRDQLPRLPHLQRWLTERPGAVAELRGP